MTVTRKILVTGATGQQGGAVARSLISKGQKVRVMTRSVEKVWDLATKGAEVARGDFEDIDSLEEAVRGVDGVFLMGTPYEKGANAEIAQGEAVLSVCRKHGVPHLVYTSVSGANLDTGIPHFESKTRIEAIIKESGEPYTILRPVWFMENFASPWLYPSIGKGVLTTPLHPDRNLQMIALSDIGEFASEAFIRPLEFLGEEIDLAGDQLTMRAIAAQISKTMDREIRYEPIPEDRAEAAVGRDLALMYRWFNEHGYRVDIDGLRKRWGIPLTSFTDWIDGSALRRKAA